MLLKLLIVLPALASAASFDNPIDKRCEGVTTLAPPVTLTSLLSTQTWGPQSGSETACSVTYTTVLPTLGPGPDPGSPGGLHPHTYTVTYGCGATDASPCELPDSKDICPPGFIRTATVCDTCGSSPVTYTLTVLESTPTTAPHATDNKGPDATDIPSRPPGKPEDCVSGHCPGPDQPVDHPAGDDGRKPVVPIPPASGPEHRGNSSTEYIAPSPKPSGGGSNPSHVGGSTSSEESRPQVTDQDSPEHVEVSAGASVKMSQWLGETLFVAVILAAVNLPL